MASDFHDHDLVFCGAQGKPLDPDSFVDHFHRIIKRADIEYIQFHGLRHSYATLSLEGGVDLKTVQKNLGHSSIAVTGDTYAHVTEKMARSAADVIGNVLADSTKKLPTKRQEAK